MKLEQCKESELDELDILLTEVSGLKISINAFGATEAQAKEAFLKIQLGDLNEY